MRRRNGGLLIGGGGGGSFELLNEGSELWRPVKMFGLMVGLNVLIGLLILFESVIVGRAFGYLLVVGTVIWAAESVGFSKVSPAMRVLWIESRRKDWKFYAGMAWGLLCMVLPIMGVWFPVYHSWLPGNAEYVVSWEAFDLGLHIARGYAVYPAWMLIIRLALILSPAALWVPITILKWVLKIESTWPGLRNAGSAPMSPDSFDSPMGRPKPARAAVVTPQVPIDQGVLIPNDVPPAGYIAPQGIPEDVDV